MRRANPLVWSTAGMLIACGCLVPNPRFMDTDAAAGTSEDETGAPTCEPDAHEPNGSESAATQLGDVRNDGPTVSLEARLESASEEDWYIFRGLHVDRTQDPVVGISVIVPDGETLSVCGFVQCESGAEMTEALCEPESGEHAHTPGVGSPGCCGENGITVPFACHGADSLAATVYVRVSIASALSQCGTYVLQYTF